MHHNWPTNNLFVFVRPQSSNDLFIEPFTTPISIKPQRVTGDRWQAISNIHVHFPKLPTQTNANEQELKKNKNRLPLSSQISLHSTWKENTFESFRTKMTKHRKSIVNRTFAWICLKSKIVVCEGGDDILLCKYLTLHFIPSDSEVCFMLSIPDDPVQNRKARKWKSNTKSKKYSPAVLILHVIYERMLRNC